MVGMLGGHGGRNFTKKFTHKAIVPQQFLNVKTLALIIGKICYNMQSIYLYFMDLHPIIVHFPIAFLTVFFFLEVISIKRLEQEQWWFYLKAVLAILGGLSAVAAAQFGDLAAHKYRGVLAVREVLHLHETFAKATEVLGLLMAANYGALWLERTNMLSRIFPGPLGFIRTWGLWVVKVINYKPLLKVLALFGLFCVVVTGGLGGMLVFGGTADPMFNWFYQNVLLKLLFLYQ